MHINISHLKTHLECPTKANYLYHLKRRPKKRYVALEVGSFWHRAMEERLNTGSGFISIALIDTIEKEIAELPDDVKDKVDKAWTSILPALHEWQMPTGWEVRAVEQELTESLPPSGRHVLQGRLDAIVWWNGAFWHLQHKTLSASTPLSTFALAMERDWHECAYQWLAQRAGYTPYNGTILNTVRKLSYKTVMENPSSALALQYVPRDNEQVEKAVRDINHICDQIEEGYRDPTLVVQNRSACTGRYGNSPCAYLAVCNHAASLHDDNLFEPAPDRYADPVETAEDA